MTTALNDFYGFSVTPFGKSIPGSDLFPARGHQEIQARLTFALQERLPALITGDVGTGKIHADEYIRPCVPSPSPSTATSTPSSTSPILTCLP